VPQTQGWKRANGGNGFVPDNSGGFMMEGIYFFDLFFFVLQPGAAFLAICGILELKSVFCMHFGARISHLRAHLAFGFTWLHLASLGFTWLHLASLGFTWLHLADGFWLLVLVSLGFSFGRSRHLAHGVCWVGISIVVCT